MSFVQWCFLFLSLLQFYILTISNVISGKEPTYNSTHSWCCKQCCPTRDNRSLAPRPNIPFSHIILYWINRSLPYLNNNEHLARKRQEYILKPLVSLNQGQNLWVRIPNQPSPSGICKMFYNMVYTSLCRVVCKMVWERFAEFLTAGLYDLICRRTFAEAFPGGFTTTLFHEALQKGFVEGFAEGFA